jgi:endo-1,4-beta-xylanase
LVTRRNLILGAAGLGLSGCVSDFSLESVFQEGLEADAELPSLRDLGAQRGIEIGSAFNGNPDPKYRQLLAHHCGLVVPEWQLKPRFLQPSVQSDMNFDPADVIAGFARSNGLGFHGHTLFWHEEPIRWAESADFDEVKRSYGGFIREVVSRYPDATSWDVFNEIVGEEAPLRDEYLIQTFGVRFIDYCLRTVNELAPEARLAINDYNLECGAHWCASKRENMLALLGDLKDMDTPLHAVGIQGHLSSVYRASAADTLAFIDRVADLGIDVFISELDVNDSAMPLNVAERDRQVAAYYEEFIGAVLEREAVTRLVFWGISDFDNWVVRGQTQEKRSVGAARPALFDARNEPKPAFYAVARALAGGMSRAT